MTNYTEAERLHRLKLATTVQRAVPIACNTMDNLAHANELPPITHSHFAPHVPFVVVGAGPSLDLYTDWLRDVQDRVYIFAGQNAHCALAADGITTDVLVLLESVNLSEHISTTYVKCAALALASNPLMWEHLRDTDVEMTWYPEVTPHNMEFALDCGVLPVFTGGATTTNAVALASRWAQTIILVGADMTYGEQGYASKAGWAGMKVTGKDEDGNLLIEHPPKRLEVHRSSGVPPVATRQTVVMREGLDGGEVAVPIQYLDQLVWLENFAKDHPATHLYNLSKGALIQGWGLGAPDIDEHAPPKPRHTEPVPLPIDKLALEAKRYGDCIRSIRDGGVPVAKHLLVGSGLVDMTMAPTILQLRESGLPPIKKAGVLLEGYPNMATNTYERLLGYDREDQPE